MKVTDDVRRAIGDIGGGVDYDPPAHTTISRSNSPGGPALSAPGEQRVPANMRAIICSDDTW
jgi:hypothetical protein